MKTVEKSLLIIAFAVAFVGIIHLTPKIISIILGLSMAIYLFMGWLLLLPEKQKETSRILPFIVSYLIAQTFATIIFGINNWPLKDTFAYVTITMVIICLGVVIILRKKLINNYPINGYILRLIICFMFAGSPLWM